MSEKIEKHRDAVSENPLSEISGFHYLFDYYNKYKGANWKEWLEFDRSITTIPQLKSVI